jgi:hypothetical protein
MTIPNADYTAWIDTANELKEEAKHWLDGNPIQSEEEASKVALLINKARDIAKNAEDERKARTKPLDDEKKTIMANYKPAIDTCETVIDVAKRVSTKWIVEQDRIREERIRAEAERLRIEQEALKKAAQEIATIDDLEAHKEAIGRQMDAQAALEKDAKQKAVIRGGGRTISTRTVYNIEIVDKKALAAWFWNYEPAALTEWLSEQALKRVRAASGNININGIKITSEKVAV